MSPETFRQKIGRELDISFGAVVWLVCLIGVLWLVVLPLFGLN
jgi:tetrahydromethanopterin S-methyltransferase subunit G